MKCTPAHDPNDYQIAKRHNLPMPICMNEDGTMNELAKDLKGLDRYGSTITSVLSEKPTECSISSIFTRFPSF